MHLPKQYQHNDNKDMCNLLWDNVIKSTKYKENNYVITMPPPNRNGSLHMGHQYNLTIQDCLIRYNKLKGDNVLFVPGTDHGGISVENMATKKLISEGKNKMNMTNEEFISYVSDFADNNQKNIVDQIKELGCFCDWGYEAYTKSELVSEKLSNLFIKLYNEDKIYKGYHITNYCMSCQTSLSDDELEKIEVKKELYHIKYKIVDKDEYITVATTQPETMFGDVAIAIHPDDKRYTHLHSAYAIIPLINKQIPIILDNYVDMSFGTGCLKITPAHDKNDHKIATKHNLPKFNIMDHSLCMINTGIYDGIKFNKCKELVLNELREQDLLLDSTKIDSIVHKCYRCNNNIICLLSDQYFLRMEGFIEHLRNSKVKFYPERSKKIMEDWINNCGDWCISRQIKWGHRLPIFICKDCGTEYCTNIMTNCKICNNNIIQIEDVLDTWFSSGMWPFIIFNDSDVHKFFPSNVLITGKDIIFFG